MTVDMLHSAGLLSQPNMSSNYNLLSTAEDQTRSSSSNLEQRTLYFNAEGGSLEYAQSLRALAWGEVGDIWNVARV